MELSIQALIWLPIGLGLLGFIEPCTIGGHLLFLDTQKDRNGSEKLRAVMVFIIVRSVTAGVFGAIIAFIGQKLIGVQTGIWLVFGIIYLLVGLAFILGRAGLIKRRISLTPAFLLPLLAGILASWFGLLTVFALSTLAAVAQALILQKVSQDLAR